MRRLYSILTSCFVFLTGLMLTGNVLAAVNCNQYLDSAPLSRTTVLGEERVSNGVYEGVAQQYNVSSGQITSVVFWGRVNPAAGLATCTLRVRIYDENLGFPGIVLGTQNVVVDSASAPYLVTATFSSPVSISAPFIVSIEPSSPTVDDYFIQRNTHPDGQFLYLNKLKQASQWQKNLAAGGDTTLNFDFHILPAGTISVAASFTHGATGNTTNFSNTSTNATSFLWEFGDGDTSTAVSPSHNYAASGAYNVKLKAFRLGIPGCVDSVTVSVPVVITGLNTPTAKKGMVLTSSLVHDVLGIEVGAWTNIRIVDVLGNQVAKFKVKPNELQQLRIDFLKPGVYIINSDIYKSLRFVKSR